jgi:glycosyltransferase involved in cell wall biosynthesis
MPFIFAKTTPFSKIMVSLSMFPKISVITPTYNQGCYIEDCIQSILSQGYPNLEYIIIDGGSTDGTLEIIKKYQNQLSFWVSEKDNGLYDALNKGFKRATGEIFGWLNSDDILHIKSLFSIAEIFSTFSEVQWLQGYPSLIDVKGRIVFHQKPRFNKYDFFLKEYRDGTFIQQESTYWRREFYDKAGSHISTKYKYAGDFELWMRFFTIGKLYTTPAMIGAFRYRGEEQISNKYYSAYLRECDMIVEEFSKTLTAEEASQIRKLKYLKSMKYKHSILARLYFNRAIVKYANKGSEIVFDVKGNRFRLKNN